MVNEGQGESESTLIVRPSLLHRAPPLFHIWALDSGATSHMTSVPGFFGRVRERSGYVRIGDGSRLSIEGVSDVRLHCTSSDGSCNVIVLKDCLYVPSLGGVSLVSVRKCQKSGYSIVSCSDYFEVRKAMDGPAVCVGKDIGNGLFELQLSLDPLPTESAGVTENAFISYPEWHAAMGHACPISCRIYADGHLAPRRPAQFHCRSCALAKSVHAVPVSLSARPSSQPLELIHTDLSDKFSKTSLGKGLYYMSFVDDFTQFS